MYIQYCMYSNLKPQFIDVSGKNKTIFFTSSKNEFSSPLPINNELNVNKIINEWMNMVILCQNTDIREG